MQLNPYKTVLGFASRAASTMTATRAHAYHYAPKFLPMGMGSRRKGEEGEGGRIGGVSLNISGMTK